jgi:hypothetical protein
MSLPRGAGSRRSAAARAVKPKDAVLNSDDEFWNQGAFEESEGDESFDEDALSDKGEVRYTCPASPYLFLNDCCLRACRMRCM